MRRGRLIRAGLRFYWRTHLAVALGAALSASILVGALIVGDSVRESLRALALARLGDTTLVVTAGEGSVRAALADEMAHALGAEAAAVAFARAVLKPEGGGPVGGVDLYGIDGRFLALAGEGAGAPAAPEGDEVLLGSRLAERLSAKAGDEVVLRFERPSALPRDVGLMPETDRMGSLRLVVRGVLPDATLGRFSLRAEQVAPLDAFCARETLASALGQGGRAHLVLVGPDGRGGPAPEAADEALRATWQAEDAGLRIERAPAGDAVQVASDRVFLPPAVSAAGAALGRDGGRVLSYLVNEVRRGERAAPYDFVAAIEDGVLGGVPALPPAEPGAPPPIVLNAWLAREVDAGPGDEVTLRYFTIGVERALEERERAFRVAAVVPVEAGDPALAPDLPGLSEEEHCRDWDPGLPIDLGALRPQDEAYWEAHHATPKAYVRLEDGQAMWSSRFGDLTAIRYPGADLDAVRAALRREVEPARLGLIVQPVREAALRAASPTVDFGQLFLGLSFFLIASALLLTALLFTFGVEQRFAEMGTLRAIGFAPRAVRRLVLAEGAWLAAIGSALGSLLGVAYAVLVIGGLRTDWIGAVQTSALSVFVEPGTIVMGAVIAFLTAMGAMAWAVRRTSRLSPKALLAGSREVSAQRLASPRARSLKGWLVAGACLAGAAAMAGAGASRTDGAGLFFGAGGLVLIGGVAALQNLFGRAAKAARARRLRLTGIGLRATARDAGRRLVTIATLATGVFLVIAVGANRKGPPADPRERATGTGGFALLVESTRPLVHDLGTEAGREAALATDEPVLADAGYVPLKVGGGDDASCLNLNQVARPRLLGVDPSALASRGAFLFSATLEGRRADDPWLLLVDDAGGDDVMPAVADANTAQWSLHVGLGDVLPYTDERGRAFRIRIVGLLGGSILQGSLIVDRARLERRFPSVEGSRMVLVDAPAGEETEVADALRRGLRDLGAEVTPAAERLAAYQAVETTYLSIFLALGGLALALGTLGLGVVVVRNVLERRGELALLAAVGFSRRRIEALLLAEHGALLLGGLVVGLAAAALAVVPTIRAGRPDAPLAETALWVVAIAASGLVWVFVAVRAGLRGRILDALRGE